MKKLFYDDQYQKTASAKVLKIDGNQVWLDQTIFFAFSGGQENDSGSINAIKVVDLKWSEDKKEIIHVLESPPTFKVGDQVQLNLDWEKRWKLMRLHSAAHVVSDVLEKHFGVKEYVGSNVTAEKSRLDIVYEENISPKIPEIEKMSNEFIARGLDVKIYEDPAEKGLRWWETEGIKMNCSGTHVRNLKEIGKVKLKRSNIGKGKERVEIKLAE